MATAKIKKYYEDDTLIISDRWFLPSKLSDLADDSTHRTVTDAEKITWNAKEDASNKSNDIATDGSSTTKYPSVKAIKDYADSLVIWLTDLRGEYNASVNTFPATWWSGTWWAILKGDVWLISVEWTLWGILHKVWDAIIAISDTPWQTAWNWGHINSWLWFVPENVWNKKTTLTDSDTDYPTTKAVNTWLSLKENTIWYTTENVANKVTTFQVTPDDTHYATEKLVKDSLDAKEDSLPVVTTNPDISYLNWNKEWATINVWAWWYGAPLYFTTIASDVSWYKKIDYVWEMSLTELTWVVNNEEKLLRTYLYDYQLDTTVIDAWPWIASFRVKVSNAVWITKLKLEPFLYHADTTETTLFSVYSSEINNTTYTVIRNESPQWVYACVATDRLWVRVYASTTANTNITVSTTVWDGDASYFTTPLAIRHDLLRNKAWTSSWHTGTASTVAWFLASTGVATEYTLSWTWTQLALTTSPVFTTPNIGSATGSASLNLLLTWWTLTWTLNIEHADWIVLWKDEAWWWANIAWKIKMFSSWDDAYYNTFTSWDNTANANYTLPVAMPAVSWYALKCTDAWVMSWGAAWWLTWWDSITSTSWTWITTTVANSSDAGTIWQSIVIWNTQTNATTWLKIDTWTSTTNNKGINVSNLQWFGIDINNFDSATQAVWLEYGLRFNSQQTFNTNSTNNSVGIYIIGTQNAWTWFNTWIYIDNWSSDYSVAATYHQWVWLSIRQARAWWTAIGVYTNSNINSSTNWLVNYTLSDTQSWATVMQKIDTGTSAQAHTGLLINANNASTNARGIEIASTSAATGAWVSFTGNSQGEWYRRIDISWTVNNTAGTCYWIKMGSLNNSSWIWYWLYITSADSTTTARWVFFSLNNTQNANIDARTLDMSEILSSRTNTATTWTKADNFNIMYLKRTSIQNWTGWTFTSAWSVLKLENVATQTAWTLTDSVTPLLIVQDADSTGAPISVTQNAVVSTNFKKLMILAWVTIWMSDWTTAEWALSWTEGDICFNGGTGAGQAAYCDATGTNWTDM